MSEDAHGPEYELSAARSRKMPANRMKFPEHFRAPHPLGFPHAKGDPFGWFMIPRQTIAPFGEWATRKITTTFAVQADAQTDWEHLSVSLPDRCPTWEEMCFLKDLFWSPEDCVVQYHPPKSDYVNLAKNCLHLWRYRGEMPRPPKNYVG